ncbi:MAG TPA: triphosphoribosyl-dephospho-CoA synthase [Vicinamibacterales bacterium]
MGDLAVLRRQLLEAREARQAAIARACGVDHAVVFLSIGIPGRDKFTPGALSLLRLAIEAVDRALPAAPLDRGLDALGPWAAVGVRLRPDAVKRATIDLESSLPAGRLLDLDVYDSAGRQVDRASVGLPPRSCLVCERPAVECIRLSRHAAEDVTAAAARLLLRALASALARGARTELELTPKPGLVDRLDSGSHPDLSFEAMSRSIDLLPAYFDDLLDIGEPLDLSACVAAGQRAERRMIEAIGTNAHKGYIFLAGLVLLAARTDAGRVALRSNISTLGHRILGPRAIRDTSATPPTHGQRARAGHGVSGILHEALQGLPSVFDRGLPVLEAAGDATDHLLMAVLMQTVEDTTAVHRCGPAGLARIRNDGVRLQRLIEDRQEYLPWLAALNDDYRRLNLTMGGVADCMALCFALHEWWDRPSSLIYDW